eukprot:scaffold1231_cov107-Cylindrotheca_fusiformis.AAC.7
MILRNRQYVTESPSQDSRTFSFNDRYRSFPPLVPEPSFRSRSIPISTGGLSRTASEVQLLQDEQAAEQRDHAFYSRVVSGICQSQKTSQSWQCQRDNQMCLLRVMQTRNDGTTPLEDADNEDDWIIGNSPSGMIDDEDDRNLTRAITSQALAISEKYPGEEDCIFEMDL